MSKTNSKDAGPITLAEFRALPSIGYGRDVAICEPHHDLLSATALAFDLSQLFNPRATGISLEDTAWNVERCEQAALEALRSRVAAGAANSSWPFDYHWLREQREVDEAKGMANRSRTQVERLKQLAALPNDHLNLEEAEDVLGELLVTARSMPGLLVCLFAVLVPLADAKDALLIGVDPNLLSIVRHRRPGASR